MTVLEWLAVVVAVLATVLVLGLGGLFLRRRLLQRGGGFDMCLRVGREGWTDGWVFGIARYRGDLLEWFRTFSYFGKSKRVLGRGALFVHGRRLPEPEEAYDLPAGHVIFICDIDGERIEVSMTEAAATAFRSWLEAAPPGEHVVA